jgi:acetyl/propionyl-CoA carboxylase alpha subunit/enoyl-CoA hydratase/carnithine racemase
MADVPLTRILIANRGEVAIRIARAAHLLGVQTVSVYPEDDAGMLHRFRTDDTRQIRGTGPAAYLDAMSLIEAAKETGCDAIHPGYGFLSESAAFAEATAAAGLIFIGPAPDALKLFGDKAAARDWAAAHGVPLLPATGPDVLAAEITAFAGRAGVRQPVMVKAMSGGGGRGMRLVMPDDDLDEAIRRCRAEAQAAFGNPALYAEHYLSSARHVEIQIAGDGREAVSLGARECSLQRAYQKLVEIAPVPGMAPALLERLADAARRMAVAADYRGLVTFEFLLEGDAGDDDAPFYFMEANPRLQVEHTVTEAVTGVDLVAAQIRLAAGATLDQSGLVDLPAARGIAVQTRICLETLGADGKARPSAGTITAFEPPGGPGVRVDTAGFPGMQASPRYDSLIAKVICHQSSGNLPAVAGMSVRALSEFRIDGVSSNLAFLRALLSRDEVRTGRFDTGFIAEHAAELVAAAAALCGPEAPASAPRPDRQVDPVRQGWIAASAPMSGMLTAVSVALGEAVVEGQELGLLEAMKMEAPLSAPAAGMVVEIRAQVGAVLTEGDAVVVIEPSGETGTVEVRPDGKPHPAIDEFLERRMQRMDAGRPEAVARRHANGKLTVREVLGQLLDPGSFEEIGGLVLAAQSGRRSQADLIAATPADGIVCGFGTMSADDHGRDRARVAVAAYDYTVLAGTQGINGHHKLDRLLEVAGRRGLPLILWAEGGGGRPGDTDHTGISGLDSTSFQNMAALSGRVPIIGLVTGRCFAGNAALLGCCDTIVATKDANIGMAGPAMISGGGLGDFPPEAIGPAEVQAVNGVIDYLVPDETAAITLCRNLFGLWQGALAPRAAADQQALRTVIPSNRLRAHDVRRILNILADEGTLVEARPRFAPGLITAMARLEGRPVGLVANDCRILGGAIDAAAADKAARFFRLCDAWGVPLVSLVDTPGFMVGPAAEETALVRRTSRMFVAGAALRVPLVAVVLRKAYGLGAMAMMGGSTRAPDATLAWPTAEFGGMGIEGAVRLAWRRELDAAPDDAARQALYAEKVDELYVRGRALSVGAAFEIDEVIDPAETRDRLTNLLSLFPVPEDRAPRPLDPW